MASFLFAADPRRHSIGLTIVRILTGIIFMAHGGQKLFVYGFAGVTGAFGQMGVPMPGIMGPFIALLEFFGGFALVIGLLTRLAALGLAFDMIGAIVLVHLAGGFFLPNGYEFALLLLGTSLALVAGGPGALAVDNIIARRRAVRVTAGRV
jgi:putative oxidoreductase